MQTTAWEIVFLAPIYKMGQNLLKAQKFCIHSLKCKAKKHDDDSKSK